MTASRTHNDEQAGKHDRVFPITRVNLALDSMTSSLLNEAETAIRHMQDIPEDPLSALVLSDICMNVEAVACTKMNGKQTNVQDIFRVLAHERLGDADADTRQETLRISDALRCALACGRSAIEPKTFIDIHRRLLTGTTRESYRGFLRSDNAPVGASRYHAFGKPYVTADASSIPMLLDDLASFCNMSSIPVVAQAALAHIQLMAIRPFARANGKTAFSVIQLVFSHRGVTVDDVIPVSLPIIVSPHDFQTGSTQALLTCMSEIPSSDILNAWLRCFAQACIHAAEQVTALVSQLDMLQQEWRRQLNVRSDSASSLLVSALPAMPVFTVNSMSAYLDRSFKRVSTATEELVAAGIIEQITPGKRNRVFECSAVVETFARIPGFQ